MMMLNSTMLISLGLLLVPGLAMHAALNRMAKQYINSKGYVKFPKFPDRYGDSTIDFEGPLGTTVFGLFTDGCVACKEARFQHYRLTKANITKLEDIDSIFKYYRTISDTKASLDDHKRIFKATLGDNYEPPQRQANAQQWVDDVVEAEPAIRNYVHNVELFDREIVRKTGYIYINDDYDYYKTARHPGTEMARCDINYRVIKQWMEKLPSFYKALIKSKQIETGEREILQLQRIKRNVKIQKQHYNKHYSDPKKNGLHPGNPFWDTSIKPMINTIEMIKEKIQRYKNRNERLKRQRAQLFASSAIE